MARQLSTDDEGKAVVGASGEKLGTVLAVTDDEIIIAPSPDATDTPHELVEQNDGGEQTGVPSDRIDAVTEDEIRVNV